MGSTKDTIIEESIASSHNPKSRILIVGLFVLLIGLLLAMALSGLALYNSLHGAAGKGVDLATQVQLACQHPKKSDQLKNLCHKADQVVDNSPVAPSSPGPSGAQGEQGPGPSDYQVSQAVAAFCATNGCTGPGPSATQVAQAVTLYCDQNGQCRGPVGGDGSPGSPGATGAPGENATGAPGPQGPPPTDDQIQSAVATYCDNHDNCQGPKGDDGKPGVVAVDSSACDPQDGQVVASVDATYDADTQKIVLACTYANAVTLPGN